MTFAMAQNHSASQQTGVCLSLNYIAHLLSTVTFSIICFDSSLLLSWFEHQQMSACCHFYVRSHPVWDLGR